MFDKPIRLTVTVLAALSAVAAAMLALRSRASSGDRGAVRTTAYDFGVVVQGQPVEHVFSFRNERGAPLAVDTVVTSYAAATATALDSVVPGGADGRVRVSLYTKYMKGQVNAFAKVRFRDEGARPVWVQLRGRVVAPVEIAPRERVYFFTVKGEGPHQEVLVINHQDRPLALLGAASDNANFHVRTETLEAGQRYRLTLALDPATPPGRDSAIITVRTDSPEYRTLTILGRAFVDDIVSTSLSKIDFSQVSYDHLDMQGVGDKIVLVRKYRGTDFQVLKATTDVPCIDVEVVPQKRGESFLVNVSIVKRRAPHGDIRGTLRIETNDPAFRELTLPITGKIM